MENKSQLGWLVGLVCLMLVLNVVGLFMAAGNKVDEKALADKVTAQVISKIPQPEKVDVDALATEVAGKIKVPEVKDVNNARIDDLWEDLYADDIDELETEAYNVAVAELEDHDYKALEKYLEANVEGFDELKNVDNYEFDDCDFTIVNLGLEDEEDKVAVVSCDLKVKYTLEEGEAGAFKKTVPMNATVTFDEGDFDDEDVVLAFA